MLVKRSAKGRFEPLFGNLHSRQATFEGLNRSQPLASTIPSSTILGFFHKSETKIPKHCNPTSTQVIIQTNQDFPSKASKHSSSENSSCTSFPHDDKQNQEPNKLELTSNLNQSANENSFVETQNEETHGWTFTPIEVKQVGYFSEDFTLEDPQIEKWDIKFAEYDMEEDQENMPCEEEETCTYESEEEEFFEEDKVEPESSETKSKALNGKFLQALAEIEEVEEFSNSKFDFSRTPVKLKRDQGNSDNE